VIRGNTQDGARETIFRTGGRFGDGLPAMTAAYLAKLNPQQRRAVEHGCDKLDEASPLLIIAGAGSGKTNTSPTASPT